MKKIVSIFGDEVSIGEFHVLRDLIQTIDSKRFWRFGYTYATKVTENLIAAM